MSLNNTVYRVGNESNEIKQSDGLVEIATENEIVCIKTNFFGVKKSPAMLGFKKI